MRDDGCNERNSLTARHSRVLGPRQSVRNHHALYDRGFISNTRGLRVAGRGSHESVACEWLWLNG